MEIINWIKYKYSKPYSKLILIDDNQNWSISWDAKELKKIFYNLGLNTVINCSRNLPLNQSIFYLNRYEILLDWTSSNRRIGFPYYHGRPDSGDEFSKMIHTIKNHHEQITRIQITHSEMHEIILETGIDPQKVFKIPIGINLDYFTLTTRQLRRNARLKLGIPQSALVIGSFQKDGNGWGEGLEPKLIKGPDIFLRTIEILKTKFENIFILLTGPSRGYMKKGLNQMGVPYLHRNLYDYTIIGEYYNALDLYIVSSRQEGGPKAVLESMASGIPLVTSKVGQAMDLVKHGKNGWIVEVGDVEALFHWVTYVIEKSNSLDSVISAGRKTAEENCYSAQTTLWKTFMNGFVDS